MYVFSWINKAGLTWYTVKDSKCVSQCGELMPLCKELGIVASNKEKES